MSTVSRRILRVALLLASCYLLAPLPAHGVSPGAWSPIGPTGGDIRGGFAYSPGFAADQTVFTVAYGPGVFKSVDGGQTWAPSKTSNDYVYAVDLGISPDYPNDQTIFLATYSEGHWRSTDGGTTWTQLSGGLPSYYVYDIEPSPDYANDHSVFAATDSGFYRSSNHGDTWELAVTGFPTIDPSVNPGDDDLYVLAISPEYATDATIFAAGYNGLFKTEDGGDNWTLEMDGITGPCESCTPNFNGLAISPEFGTDATVFSSVSQTGVFKSTDGGDNWVISSTGIDADLTGRMSFSPAYAIDETLFVSGWTGMWQSTDGGENWSLVTGNFGGYWVNSVAVSPDFTADRLVLAGNLPGVWRSADGGATWAQSNTGINGLAVVSLAPSPGFATDQTLFAGTWAGLFRSADRGATWSPLGPEPGAVNVLSVVLSPDFPSDHTLFGASGFKLFRSQDGGDGWQQVVSDQLGYDTIQALAVSPGYPADQTLFAGTYSKGIFRSTDGGDTWGLASTGIPYLSGTTYPMVNAIAISPAFAADHTLFAAVQSAGGLYRSTDGGDSWQPLTLGKTYNMGLALALSPAFATDHTLFLGTVFDGILVSTDGGDTWDLAGTGLQTEGVYYWALAISPTWAVDGVIYAGSANNGVFRSLDGAQTWEPFNDGLTDVNIRSLAISPAFGNDQTVYVGTTWDSAFILSASLYGTFELDGGADYAHSPEVTADNNVVGATEMRFSLDAGVTWTTWEDYASTRLLTLDPVNGTKTVQAEFRDAAANVLALVDSIILDTIPLGSFTINNGAIYARTTAVTAYNAVTRAAGMRFSTNGGGTWSAWQAYAPTKALVLGAANGTKTVLGEFRDAWGNVVRFSDSIILDTVGPATLGLRAATVRYGRTAVLAYRVNDALSPTATVTIKITRTVFSRTTVVKTLALGSKNTNRALTASFVCRLARGKYRFLVYAKDLAGNSQRLPVGANNLTVW